MSRVWPLYIRIPLVPIRILGIIIFIVPMIIMILSGFDDEGIEALTFIMNYGNKENWRK